MSWGSEKTRELKELIAGIREFKKKIGVEKAVLFGSYATGNAGKDSDVDLILLSEKFEGRPFHKRMKGLWLQWQLGLPADFLCYTPKEFEKMSKEVTIASHALKHGITI